MSIEKLDQYETAYSWFIVNEDFSVTEFEQGPYDRAATVSGEWDSVEECLAAKQAEEDSYSDPDSRNYVGY